MDDIIALLRLKLTMESSFSNEDYKKIKKYIDQKIDNLEQQQQDEFTETYLNILKDMKNNFNDRFNTDNL